jgi:hypothetical protein
MQLHCNVKNCCTKYASNLDPTRTVCIIYPELEEKVEFKGPLRGS